MDTLRTAILCACTAALGLTLAEGIFPMERYERQMRLLLSLLLLIGLLQPLREVDWQSFASASTTAGAEATLTDTAATTDAILRDAVADNLIGSLNQRLASYQVPCTVEDVIVHIQPDGSITISEVIIRGNLLTGTVYLREWLDADLTVTEQKEAS